MTTYPFHDTTDFEDADRGFIGALDPCVVKTEKGRVVWDNDAYAFLDDECPDTANPSLWRQSQLVREAGPVRGHRRHLPGARPRPVEHDAGRGRRGRDRDRSAHLEGDGGRRPGAVPRASRRPPGHRGHLHARPRRPLRRRPRRVPRGHPDRRRTRLHGSRGRRERLRRRRHEPPRRSTCTAPSSRRARAARSAPDSVRPRRSARSASSRRRSRSPTPARRRRSTACSSGSR